MDALRPTRDPVRTAARLAAEELAEDVLLAQVLAALLLIRHSVQRGAELLRAPLPHLAMEPAPRLAELRFDARKL